MNKELILLTEFIQKRFYDAFDFELTESTTVEDDLGITGHEASDFIVAYGEYFSVNVSRFMAADYFDPEGGTKPTTGKILTLGHLIKGMQAGRLDESVINA